MYYEKYLKYKQKYLELKNMIGGYEIDIFFNKAKKDLVIDKVLTKVTQSVHLKELKKNYSAEGGFELPLTSYWRETLYNNPNLQYHSARELRFVNQGDNIVGLRFKDSIPYWNSDELKELKELINSALNEI